LALLLFFCTLQNWPVVLAEKNVHAVFQHVLLLLRFDALEAEWDLYYDIRFIHFRGCIKCPTRATFNCSLPLCVYEFCSQYVSFFPIFRAEKINDSKIKRQLFNLRLFYISPQGLHKSNSQPWNSAELPSYIVSKTFLVADEVQYSIKLY
jgi:hypothetical protein